ncbi:MAG: DNA polymerase III subunit delta' [Gammaproteobacteria bacterium]|uniref:DNA polymerase III subunit delta' n=1 Tax=OM182 bacterium MED-G24 TaxID=1986255 RepID=A0A2A5WS52_9GAMM|nr:DNA polymerase III subunit delta' [Gammaproteobacteria bacterium]PDH39098.1 MAG: DNA polymerase III subunit delta' [OM182 bacterium MED-G24]RPG26371.1 MAG: DNA polymerase III subunit delta' [Gammaproteobacteria bacterium TMED50]
MAASALLPWHVEHWQRIQAQVAANRLPHALLFAGPTGLGKRLFANRLMDLRLCADNDGSVDACGVCANCLLRKAETHPDRFELMPEDGSDQIKIDQVRTMVDWAYQTAQRGKGKYVLIAPAEVLNIQSANALLKCLEEPPSGTHFVLIADTPGQLIPTIRSRCSTMFFRPPPTDAAMSWLESQTEYQPEHEVLLKIAGGAPLAVEAMINAGYLETRACVLNLFSVLRDGGSPVSAASVVVKQMPETVIGIMVSLILDLVRLVRGDIEIRHVDVTSDLAPLSRGIPEAQWFLLLDYLIECRALLASGANPNAQLMMEGICTRTAEALA